MAAHLRPPAMRAARQPKRGRQLHRIVRRKLIEVGHDPNRLRRIAREFLCEHNVHLSRIVSKIPNLGVVLGSPELAGHCGGGKLGDEKAKVAPLRCVSLEYLDGVASNEIAASKLLGEGSHGLDVLSIPVWIRDPSLDEEIRGHLTSRGSA